MKFKIPVDF